MGVTRVDDIRRNIAVTRLREARQVNREVKGSRQRVGGHNLRYFVVDNSGEYAWTGQLDTESPHAFGVGYAMFEVTLDCQDAEYFSSDIAIEQYKSDDGGMTYTFDTWYPVYLTVKPMTANTPHQVVWQVIIDGPLDSWAALKVQAVASAPVTMGVVRTE